MTKTYNIMNYEPQENGGDCEYTIGKLFAMPDGSALLVMHAEKVARKEAFRNKNAALAAVREAYGWPNAFLEAVREK